MTNETNDGIWSIIIAPRRRPIRVAWDISLARAEYMIGLRLRLADSDRRRDAICIIGGGRRRWPQVTRIHSGRPCRRTEQAVLRMIRRQMEQ